MGQVEFAARELGQLPHGLERRWIGGRTDTQRDQCLFKIEADRVVAEEVFSQGADGLDDRRADQCEMIRNVGHLLDGVEHESR